MELLKSGFAPFVERGLRSIYNDRATADASRFMGECRLNAKRPITDWDVAARVTLAPINMSTAVAQMVSRALANASDVAKNSGSDG